MIALLVVATLTTSGIAVANHTINSTLARIERVQLQVAAAPPEGANYLILGSDTRAGDELSPEDKAAFCDPVTGCDAGGRSDTLMVAHVEPSSRRTVVVSFPRDLWVTLPDGSRGKINGAYAENGAQGVIDTLKNNFNVDIHHYLEVDFRTFREIVDAIGNIKVSFPYPTRDDLSGLFVAQPGCVVLKGDDALAYVRARYLDYQINGRWTPVFRDQPDLHRIERQQAFIKQLAGIAVDKGLHDPLLAKKMTDNVLEFLKADQVLSRGDINALLQAFRTVNVNDTSALDFRTVPTVSYQSPDGQSALKLVQPDAEGMLARLRTFGGGDTTPSSVLPSSVRVRVEGSGTGDLDPVAVLGALERQGFVGAGTTSASTVKISEIRYRPNVFDAARLLADYIQDALARRRRHAEDRSDRRHSRHQLHRAHGALHGHHDDSESGHDVDNDRDDAAADHDAATDHDHDSRTDRMLRPLQGGRRGARYPRDLHRCCISDPRD